MASGRRGKRYADRETGAAQWTEDGAYTAAIAALARRPLSEGEVHSRLRRLGVHADCAAAVVLRLRRENLLDDDALADRILERGREQGWGIRRIRTEMNRRHIPEDTAHRLLSAVADPDIDLLTAECIRKTSPNPARPERERRRISGWLQRRGHNWETIMKVLHALGMYTND